MADQKLTVQDVERLLRDPSSEARAETARKLAQQFDPQTLSDSERKLAEDIFRLMVHDAEVRVREALATHLKENPLVPHDVARALARDVDSVALPVLEFSAVLTPEDLVEIVTGQGNGATAGSTANTDRLLAVARRATLQPEVADALVERGTVEVAATLAANRGAQIAEASMLRMVERFGDDARVQDPLAHRAVLPVTVAEKLVHKVSEALRAHILENHELPPDLAADLVMQSRERATIALSSESSEDEVDRLVCQMATHGRLTPSIVLRAVCMGDIKFFEYALAVRAGVPVVNARSLIHDSGPLGLRGLYDKAGLPRALFPAVRAAVDVTRETDYDGGENDRERYQRRMLERVLTQYGDLGVTMEGGDLEYLFAKMSQLPASYGAEG